mgnify:CR=1 FL=1
MYFGHASNKKSSCHVNTFFTGQKLVKTATVHTLLQQPLHSRGAPLLLPSSSCLFPAWRQVASFYRRLLPGFGLFSRLSFSSVGPF